MNKTEILERINNVADARDKELARKVEDRRTRLNAKVMAINALGPRIKNMLDIAKTMWERRIPIGHKMPAMIGIHSDLVTDGIDHRLGFYVDSKREWSLFDYRTGYPYAFGIEGGGCSGYGLEIDDKGIIVRGMPDRYGSAEDKMDYVIEHFDEFERKFYDYIESL